MLKRILLNRKLFAICSTLTVIAFSYAFTLSDDPRLIDGGLTFDEAYWWELLLIFLGLISIFAVLFSSLGHALKYDRNKWFVMILLIWPLAYIYGILINSKYIEE